MTGGFLSAFLVCEALRTRRERLSAYHCVSSAEIKEERSNTVCAQDTSVDPLEAGVVNIPERYLNSGGLFSKILLEIVICIKL